MNVLKLHQETVEAVYAYDYYVSLFNVCKKGEPEPTTPEEVCKFWNNFRYALPDNIATHREPFNQICTLAEGSYLEH